MSVPGHAIPCGNKGSAGKERRDSAHGTNKKIQAGGMVARKRVAEGWKDAVKRSS